MNNTEPHPLRVQRNRVGISQVELARRAGINHRTVLRIENRQTPPSRAVLRCLSFALGVSEDALR